MMSIALEAKARQLSAALVMHGLDPNATVHAVVEVADKEGDLVPTSLPESGEAFDWLGEEPELYTDADLKKQAG